MEKGGGFALGLGVGMALCLSVYWYTQQTTSTKKRLHTSASNAELYDGYVQPPLPEAIVKLLLASRLCFLATQADGEPHLSLMNFTYYQAEELIIFATRRNTKKFDQMMECNSVAILIHDFPHLHESEKTTSHGKSYSITLNGVSLALPEGSEEEKLYREIHLKNNPDYAQFIVGPEIAVVLVKVDRARLCNIKDQVTTWSSKEGK